MGYNGVPWGLIHAKNKAGQLEAENKQLRDENEKLKAEIKELKKRISELEHKT